MLKGKLRPETLIRIQAEVKAQTEKARIDLYKRLILAAYNNRHNPTGIDYLESAKRMRINYPFLKM
mgnify:CR=1 FL=1